MASERNKERARIWLSYDPEDCYWTLAGYCVEDQNGMIEELAELLDEVETDSKCSCPTVLLPGAGASTVEAAIAEREACVIHGKRFAEWWPNHSEWSEPKELAREAWNAALGVKHQ